MNCYNNIILNYDNINKRYKLKIKDNISTIVDCMFDKWIDMCYILTMENSTRITSFMNQLNRHCLYHTITIQVNKGYKICKKNLYKQSSIQDINESYLNVFKNAKANNYKNIMILEDDFFFENINQEIADSIGKFINNNYYHIYNLGPIGHISIPSFNVHHKSLISTTSHSVIYSSYYIEHYIENYGEAMKHNSDLYWNKIEIIKYKYIVPLCFQTFPITDNQANWEIPQWFIKFAIFSIKILKLDKMHQPGYNILNIMGYIPFIILLVLLIYLYYL